MLKKFHLLLSFFVCSFVLAQNGTASPYSLGGLGDVTFRGNAINRMMGGLSVYSDSIHANINNPASLGELKLTTFSVGLHYKETQLSSNETKERTTSGSLDYIAVSIPTKRFAFSFGIMPYSSVGYQLQSIVNENDDNLNTILNRYEGKGGINKTFLSAGVKIFKGFNLGLRANYNFGSISTEASRQEENIDFGTYLVNESEISGLDYQLSAHIKLPLGQKGEIDLFGAYSPEHELSSDNSRVIFTRSVSTQNVGSAQEIDLESLGLNTIQLTIGDERTYGLSVGQDKKWMLGAQFTAIASGNFRNDFIQLENVSYENSSRLSIGGFYLPNYSSITSYWKRIVFRAGFRQETTGIMINNTSLEETGISFGASLPLGGFYTATNVSGFSSLNVGLEIGKRGVSTGSLVEENYWTLRVGFSLNDLWFIKKVYN